jgi:hypothetical protein
VGQFENEFSSSNVCRLPRETFRLKLTLIIRGLKAVRISFGYVNRGNIKPALDLIHYATSNHFSPLQVVRNPGMI